MSSYKLVDILKVTYRRSKTVHKLWTHRYNYYKNHIFGLNDCNLWLNFGTWIGILFSYYLASTFTSGSIDHTSVTDKSKIWEWRDIILKDLFNLNVLESRRTRRLGTLQKLGSHWSQKSTDRVKVKHLVLLVKQYWKLHINNSSNWAVLTWDEKKSVTEDVIKIVTVKKLRLKYDQREIARPKWPVTSNVPFFISV